MKKKLIALMLSLAMGLVLTACGEEETASTTDASSQVESGVTQEGQDAFAGTEESGEVADETEEETYAVYITLGNPSEMPLYEMPDLSNTIWSFAGGWIDSAELSEEEFVSSLKVYGGVLQFVFYEDGSAQMVQGNGALEGVYEYMEGGIRLTFDNNGSPLVYACALTEIDGISVLIAYSDETLANAVYLVCEG